MRRNSNISTADLGLDTSNSENMNKRLKMKKGNKKISFLAFLKNVSKIFHIIDYLDW